MASDYLPDDLKVLWQELSIHPFQLSPDQLRKEAEKFRGALRRRAILGIGAAASVGVSWAFFFFLFHNWLQRIGSILTVAGTLYMVIQLLLRPPRTMPDVATTSGMQFYRAELERQRDFHRGAWFWSRLAIFTPGPLVWLVGGALDNPRFAIFIWLEFVVFVSLAAASVPMNLRMARRYQRRIDTLNAVLKKD